MFQLYLKIDHIFVCYFGIKKQTQSVVTLTTNIFLCTVVYTRTKQQNKNMTFRRVVVFYLKSANIFFRTIASCIVYKQEDIHIYTLIRTGTNSKPT